MQEVRVTTNFGYAVLTVVTLGIWSPMEIEWRCAKQPPPNPVPLGFVPPESSGFPAQRTPIPPIFQQEETHGAKWPS
jgi:hypothetical protein